MQMKFSFHGSELQEILATEVSKRLNRPVSALDLIAWDDDDEELLSFSTVEISCEFVAADSPQPQDLIILHPQNSEPHPA